MCGVLWRHETSPAVWEGACAGPAHRHMTAAPEHGPCLHLPAPSLSVAVAVFTGLFQNIFCHFSKNGFWVFLPNLDVSVSPCDCSHSISLSLTPPPPHLAHTRYPSCGSDAGADRTPEHRVRKARSRHFISRKASGAAAKSGRSSGLWSGRTAKVVPVGHFSLFSPFLAATAPSPACPRGLPPCVCTALPC